MKKFLGILLCLCMLSGLMVAGVAEGGELPRYKIAFMYSNFTDKLGSQLKGSMEYIADDMNVEFVFIESGYGEEAIAALEAAVAGGDVDGVIVVQAPSPAIMEAVGGIPLIAVLSSKPASEAEAQEVASYANFLGSVADDDYQAGYNAAQALYDAGCRNVALAGLTQGMSQSHDDRANAFIDFVNEHDDMTLLADNYSRGLQADAISSFAAAYPEMDGIFSTSGSDAILNTMRTEGLIGYVKLATIDVSSESGEYFDNGTLAWCAGGQYGTAMVGFAMLYSYLADGTVIIEDTTVAMERPNLTMASFAEYETYIKYVDSGVPVYTSNEIKDMIHYYNDAANYDYFVNLNATYSLEDISLRHADLLD